LFVCCLVILPLIKILLGSKAQATKLTFNYTTQAIFVGKQFASALLTLIKNEKR
jgi:hypothetical protein